MREELTWLLRAQPFEGFIVMTRDGEPQQVDTVERLSIGVNAIAYVDLEGYISIIPYSAIDRVVYRDDSHREDSQS